MHKSFPHAAGLAAHAPPPHALDELPAADAAVAVAWRPASGARASGTPGLGSTADSTAGPDRPGYTLGAGRSAGRDAGRWSKRPDRDYARDVPREGLLPKGPPERSAKSLGHFFVMSSPPLDETTAALNLAGPCSQTYRSSRRPRRTARIRPGVIEITGKVHHADEARRGREGDKEGDCVDFHLPLEGEEGSRRRSKPSRAAHQRAASAAVNRAVPRGRLNSPRSYLFSTTWRLSADMEPVWQAIMNVSMSTGLAGCLVGDRISSRPKGPMWSSRPPE